MWIKYDERLARARCVDRQCDLLNRETGNMPGNRQRSAKHGDCIVERLLRRNAANDVVKLIEAEGTPRVPELFRRIMLAEPGGGNRCEYLGARKLVLATPVQQLYLRMRRIAARSIQL